MEINPPDQTRRDATKPIRRAQFLRGPGASEETWMYTAKCITCMEMMPCCRCTSVVSTSTAPASSSLTQTQRSGLFGLCLNCPLDSPLPCSGCSAASAASLDRSSVLTTGAPPVRSASTHHETVLDHEDRGSVYNTARRGAFCKPSTTTAMTMPAAEEQTVYNGKIGPFLFSGNQFSPSQTDTSTLADAQVGNDVIFDAKLYQESRLISFGKLPSSAALAIHTAGAATEEERTMIHTTSLISDYNRSQDRPAGPSKRSWQEHIMEDATNDQSPHNNDSQFGLISSSMQELSGTTLQLPAPVPPSSSSGNKRRKTEKRHVRVPVDNSEQSLVPPDPAGYRWWKSGQKNIKGSPYPRSYYNCKTTRTKCHAKRAVTRAVDDASMLDITYKGEHSHGRPVCIAAAVTVPATVPADAEPLEESATTKPTNFIEYL